MCAHATAHAGTIAGVAVDKSSYDALAGVTVVATSRGAKGVTHAEITDEVCDPIREDTGLARAGAGNHEYRAVGGGDGMALGGVQRLKKIGIRHWAECTENRDSNYRGVSTK